MNFSEYHALITEMPHMKLPGSELPIDLELENVPRGDNAALLRQLNSRLPEQNRAQVVDQLFQDNLFLNILRRYFPDINMQKLKSRLI